MHYRYLCSRDDLQKITNRTSFSFAIIDVNPNDHFTIMKQKQQIYDIAARALTGMRDIFNECKPDMTKAHVPMPTSTNSVQPA